MGSTRKLGNGLGGGHGIDHSSRAYKPFLSIVQALLVVNISADYGYTEAQTSSRGNKSSTEQKALSRGAVQVHGAATSQPSWQGHIGTMTSSVRLIKEALVLVGFGGHGSDHSSGMAKLFFHIAQAIVVKATAFHLR